MKKWAYGAIAAVLIAAGLAWISAAYVNAPARVKLGNSDFSMRIARTTAEREQGLSGTSELPENEVLVFVFPYDEQWGIWMKDMNYPIDIVWLDSAKKVRHIVRNAKPSSYPDETFRSKTPTRYVIELKAGAVDRSRITIGSQAVFDSTKGTFE